MAKKVTLVIQGMACPNCAMVLEGIEESLSGVVMAEASYHKAQMVVEFEERKVTIEQIRAEVTRLGYAVAEVRR
jgi:copper chaperone